MSKKPTIIEAVNHPENYFYKPEKLKPIVKPDDIVPFYLLRPTALPFLNLIIEFLEKQPDVTITSQRRISQFETMAPYIYPVSPDDENTYLWLMVTRAILPDDYNFAKALLLEPKIKQKRIFELKIAVRKMLGVDDFVLIMPNSTKKETNLHHFHAPDEDELPDQFNTLMHFSTED